MVSDAVALQAHSLDRQVFGSNPPGSVNPTFQSNAATSVLNCCSAAFRDCEFGKGTGKRQVTRMHQNPCHPCRHRLCPDPTSPDISTCRHKCWQGPQLCWRDPKGFLPALLMFQWSSRRVSGLAKACCPEPHAADQLLIAPSFSVPQSPSSFHFLHFLFDYK